jgi:hypothetical protein
MLRWGLLVAALFLPEVGHAQNYIRLPGPCNMASPPPGVSNGYMDENGNICVYTSLGVTSTNLTQIDGTAASTGAGATGAGSLRTTTAQDPTTIAGSAPGTPLSTYTPPIAYSESTTASVTTSSATLIAAGAYTHSLTIFNNGAGNVWLNVTCGSAVVGSGIIVPAGHGGFVFGDIANPVPTACITAISDSGTANLSITGG